MTGSWDSHISEVVVAGTPTSAPQLRTLWRRPPSGITPGRYGFSPFSVFLNQLPGPEEPPLPPTDSRLRPDQRLLEEGRFVAAQQLKISLEEAQRVARKAAADQGKKPPPPRWFKPVSPGELLTAAGAGGGGALAAVGGPVAYGYRGLFAEGEGYWKARERGDWSAAPQ